MADFSITENPQLTQTMEQFTDKTPGSYKIFNKVWQMLLDNDNASVRMWRVVLPAAGWSEASPFTQMVAVEGMLVRYSPIPGILYPDGCSKETKKAIDKAAGCITSIRTGDGTVMITCYEKPIIDFIIGLKGV